MSARIIFGSTADRVSMVSIPDRHGSEQLSEPDNIPQIDRVSAIADRAITVGNLLLIRGQNLVAPLCSIIDSIDRMEQRSLFNNL